MSSFCLWYSRDVILLRKCSALSFPLFLGFYEENFRTYGQMVNFVVVMLTRVLSTVKERVNAKGKLCGVTSGA
jgi:hypothetical protein